MHHFALRAGRLPWELEADDPPADKFMQALAIEDADAEGRRQARERDQRRQAARARG